MSFEPDEETGLIRAGQALLIDPRVIAAHIGIDERTLWIRCGGLAIAREELTHGLLMQARRESGEERQRLSSA